MTYKKKFHAGEIELQKHVGMAERADKISQVALRDHMPIQHRQFFQQLPFIMIGHIDTQGAVWASMVAGKLGFIESPKDTLLTINAQPVKGDPLAQLLEDTQAGRKTKPRLGLLGIELPTRRRNRINGELINVTDNSFQIKATQTFGNCPKYIQVKKVKSIPQPAADTQSAVNVDRFTGEIAELIKNCDLFFVASTNQSSSTLTDAPEYDGADVSHRGGQPGFVKLEDEKTLTVPDYFGNSLFNTLGNFLINPAAGLLFLDIQNGHLLTLTGQAEVLLNDPEQSNFEGAERLWRFRLDHGKLLKNALPLAISEF